MMKGGRTPVFFSGQWVPPSLSASFSPLSFPEHPRLSPAFAHAPYNCQTQVDARGRGKAADAGQSHALERLAEHLTVDAALPDHLEPPTHASRGASMSATRHRAGPLLSPSLSPPAARAPEPPESPNGRAHTHGALPLPRSLSPSPSTWATPMSAADSPEPPPAATAAISAGARRPRPR